MSDPQQPSAFPASDDGLLFVKPTPLPFEAAPSAGQMPTSYGQEDPYAAPQPYGSSAQSPYGTPAPFGTSPYDVQSPYGMSAPYGASPYDAQSQYGMPQQYAASPYGGQPAPYGQSMPYGYPMYAPPPSKGLSIASLVLGIGSLFIGFAAIVGLILGIMALKREPAGRGMAIAGVIISSLMLLVTIGFVIIAIVATVMDSANTY